MTTLTVHQDDLEPGDTFAAIVSAGKTKGGNTPEWAHVVFISSEGFSSEHNRKGNLCYRLDNGEKVVIPFGKRDVIGGPKMAAFKVGAVLSTPTFLTNVEKFVGYR